MTTTLEERAATPDMKALDPDGRFQTFTDSLRRITTDAQAAGEKLQKSAQEMKRSMPDQIAQRDTEGAPLTTALLATAQAVDKAHDKALREAESAARTSEPATLDDLRAAPVWREPSVANGFEGRHERPSLDSLGAQDLAAQVEGWRRWIEQHAGDTEELERLKATISQGDPIAAYAFETLPTPIRDLALASMLRPAEIEGARGMLEHLRAQYRRARDPEGFARVRGLRLLGELLEVQVRAAALAIRKYLTLPLDVPAQIIPILSRLSPKNGARPLL